MTKNNYNTYDFIINEDNEIMLLLYARTSKPDNPYINIDTENMQATLYRSQTEGIIINDITEEIMEILCESKNLLICELSNETDVQIVNAYEAKINN